MHLFLFPSHHRIRYGSSWKTAASQKSEAWSPGLPGPGATQPGYARMRSVLGHVIKSSACHSLRGSVEAT